MLRARDVLTTYVTNIVKRWAEVGVYDRLADTPHFHRLTRLRPEARYAIEAALSVVGAWVEATLPDRGPAHRVARSLLTDAPAEISKRLLNGVPAARGPVRP